MKTIAAGQKTMGSTSYSSYEMTTNQQLIKLGQQKHPDVPLYEVPYVFHIDGVLDVIAFRLAFERLVESCELLRLVASDLDWTSLQVADRPTGACRFLDFSADANPVLSAEEYVRARIVRPLSPCESLFDSCLVRTGPTTWQWFLKLHHLITDGWNTNLLVQHLADHYVSVRDSKPAPAHPDYAAFRAFEVANQAQDEFRKHQQWWSQRTKVQAENRWYADANPELRLHHKRIVVRLRDEENSSINRASGESPFRQFSPALSHFNLFATALSALMFRLRPLQPVRFGVTSHGRTQPEFRDTVGLFMQLLPFEVNAQAGESLSDLSVKVGVETRGFLQHSVSGCMRPDTAASFDVALNVLDLDVDDFAGLPVAASWRHNGFGDSERKLTISVHQPDDGNEWELIFDFNLEFFPFCDHEILIDQFRRIVAATANGSETLLEDLDWLSESQKRFNKTALTTTGSSPAVETNIWQQFDDVVHSAGDAVAVSGSQTEWSYAELRRQARELGAELEQLSTARIVPVLCRRDANAVVGFLSVLASGRVFLPIDVDQPRERINQLLSESGATHVIEAVDEPIVVALKPPLLRPEERVPDDACYVLYTSGSTGTPNAVMVGHRSLVNLLDDFERISPAPGRRCSWWTNVGFDVAIYEIFSALLYGRTLCVPSDAIRNQPTRFFSWMNQEAISSAYLPPFFVAPFARFQELEGCENLRRLLVGVEPIPQSTLARIGSHGKNLTVVNGYGPTEATVCATLQVIDMSNECPGPARIGQPVSGNVLRIQDPFGQPVPPGVAGELLIGGVGLALGYLGNQVLTDERFVSIDSDDRSRVWYRTGDLVRLSDDGSIQFVGRTDDQIKIRGHRIEPGEIVAVLLGFDGVSDAIVDVVREDGREPLLVAWVSGASDEAEIRSLLLKRLPGFLVPARIVSVDGDLPRNVNGKPDRNALWEIRADRALETNMELPQSSLESTLLAAWREIIGVQEIGVSCNLFESGGDSLDVLRLIAAAESVGLALSMSHVFERPTIRQLCEIRDDAETAASIENSDSPKSDTGSERERQLPMSPAQKGVWYVAQTSTVSDAYHMQIATEFDGILDANVMARCVESLIGRHEALSTGIRNVDGVPELWFDRRARATFQAIDLIHPSDRKRVLSEQVKRGFVFDGTELVRILLLSDQNQKSVIAITAHHIVLDQYSVGLIMAELAELYSADVASRVPTLTSFSRPASDFADWRQQQRQNAKREQLNFWQEQLAGISADLRLPFDYHSQSSGPSVGRLSSFCLPSQLADRVRKFASEHRVTLNSVLLAAWQALICRYSDETDFCVGVPVSRRGDSGFLTTVGFLIESMPFPCHVDSSAGFKSLVADTDIRFRRATGSFSPAVQDILTEASPQSAATGQLPYQTMFVMQGGNEKHRFGDATSGETSISDLNASKFDLTLFVSNDREQSEIACQLEYRQESFDEATAVRIQRHWAKLVEELVRTPDAPITSVPFLCDDDQKAMDLCHRHDWSESSLALQPEGAVRCDVLSQFDVHVSARPDAAALVFGGHKETYASLDARAESISMALKSVGVGPGHCVALLCERSVEMVAGIVGILKTGAAYVPIDPRQPPSRIAGMLEASQSVAAVCQPEFEHVPHERLSVVVGERVVRLRPVVRLPDRDDRRLAYVIFTSGSTGQPKGVEVSRRALWESTMARQEFYADNPQVFLLLSPVWFDSSVAGLFWTLTTGGTLIIPEEESLQDIVALGTLVQRYSVTHTLCLPTVYRLLLEHNSGRQLDSLQSVIVAGESCVAQTVREHFQRLPSTRLYNEYGPTEASVWSTCEPLRKDAVDRSVSIGRAAPGVEIRLFDRWHRPVPIGVTGEVYLSGTRLAEGYCGQPELTAERFPLIDGKRFYRTGDLACMSPCGRLQFQGRVDSQIKVNGQRVEVEEIESVIAEFPGVREAAVALVSRPVDSDTDVESITRQLSELDTDTAELLLAEVEDHPVGSDLPGGVIAGEMVRQSVDGVGVDLYLPDENYIATPRSRQRKWMIRQAMQELLSNLAHLNHVAPTLAAGSDEHHLPRDLATERLSDQEIMEDWQTPLMQAMAEYGCRPLDDVLEIGFGRGVAATFIQQRGVASHTIVEMNPHSITDHFVPWRRRFADREISLIEGRWQDRRDQMSDYDSVFFHAFPMSETEFEEHVLNSSTYAEHFFSAASDLLRSGGTFTYMSTEIDSLSRRHQRSLLQHFSEIQMKVVPLKIPDSTRDAWWADSMVVIRAIK